MSSYLEPARKKRHTSAHARVTSSPLLSSQAWVMSTAAGWPKLGLDVESPASSVGFARTLLSCPFPFCLSHVVSDQALRLRVIKESLSFVSSISMELVGVKGLLSFIYYALIAFYPPLRGGRGILLSPGSSGCPSVRPSVRASTFIAVSAITHKLFAISI